MLPGFITRGPAIGEADIVAFEHRCGFRLPADYRQFLMDQNGGEREPLIPPGQAIAREGSPQHHFFALGAASTLGISASDAAGIGGEVAEAWPGAEHDLEVVTTWCRDGGYPPELLPVASVNHGDLLLLRLAGPYSGAVYLSFDPGGYDEGHVSGVAASFAEFLRNWG